MKLLASVSKVDITCDRNKVHDRLYAKLLMLKYNDEVDLLISMDCISLGGGICDFSDEVYPKIKKMLNKNGIKNTICGTTHTHTPYQMTKYEDEVVALIEEKIPELLTNLEPVTVGSGKAHAPGLMINRDIELNDGSEWTIRMAHPCPPEDMYDKLNKADDTINIIRIDKEDKSPLCIMFSFSCHPLLGFADDEITANYPGVAERFIEEHTGAMAMMFEATAGDIIELKFKDPMQPKDCTYGGTILGNTVLKEVKNIKTKQCDLSSYSVSKDFKLRTDIPEIIAKLKNKQLEICEKMEGCAYNFKQFLPVYLKYMIDPEYPLDHKFIYLKHEELGSNQLKEQDRINRYQIQRYLDNMKAMEEISRLSSDITTLNSHLKRIQNIGNETFNAEVCGIRIGDIYLISAPVEPLTDLYNKIKEINNDFILFSYSNGYMHYGATEDKYEKGGYEVCECDLDKSWIYDYLDAVKEISDNL